MTNWVVAKRYKQSFQNNDDDYYGDKLSSRKSTDLSTKKEFSSGFKGDQIIQKNFLYFSKNYS